MTLNSVYTKIRTPSIEGVHRHEKRAAPTTGQIIGLNAFNLDGLAYKRQWLRGSIGLERQWGEGVATVMFNTSSETNGPKQWLYMSYRQAF